ncbi:type II toxin-antitoxin system VapC family toxin [Sphaerospermopsis torques-reginae]|uniref:Type II toxin-antitoxin system VapC family toxin n=1 Tax=Sphaerospermopsis torques-reginae ITEP-024 TaxID=984208 RepID=A0ABX8WXU9_9CYAN|nr:type II toxin-antitoxin system VapC family toxin [Sphaerospermopsis torques-reginae]QYX31257.1 type II toxin-antitoxin system VapC family toxin [Sphaerospermopsis torques-reginae ITEP-024]
MKFLLDTQCWLWWFVEPERLNEEAIAQIADENNELWLSVASVWEMGIKVAMASPAAGNGKLPLPEPIDSYISSRMVRLGAKYLEITASHALRTATLPLHHKDPFDRMLIAQAQMEDMTIITADPMFKEYQDTAIIWAANKS